MNIENIQNIQKICSSCQQKLIKADINNINSIWGFNPFLFNTFKTLKNAFRIFYKNNAGNNSEFYSSYNENGYTYTQWYIYIIAKNNYKYRNLKKVTLWLFQVLSGYDFFKKLIILGKKEDTLHNTLHHFLKYLDNTGLYQDCVLKLLIENDLSMHIEDGDGMTGNDYLIRKMLSEDDLKKTKEITRQYKNDEDLLFSNELFNKSFERCTLCNNFIDIYKDIIENKTKIINFPDILSKFKLILEKRQECIDIYQKYENCNNSTYRHMYVVEVYKNLLS